MKTIHFLFSLALALTIASCSKNKESTTVPLASESIPVRTILLNQSDFDNTIYASGQFTTNDETLLSFKTGGVVKRIFVREGDQVKQGQVLATLDLTEISAQVNQAQVAFDKASRDFIRTESLYNDSVVSLEQLQNARSGMEIARQQLAGARFNLSYSEIKAPHDGVVLEKSVSEGQIVGPGTPVLQVSSKGKADWILRVALSDREWARTSILDKAFVNIEALNLEKVEGFVLLKAENTDPMTGSFTLDIKLKNARTLDIASGMFGKAEIKISHKQRAWKIPYDALLDGNGGLGFVFVTNDDKIALKVPVKIASVEKNEVWISNGLSGYRSLIISGSAYLTDRSRIQVIRKPQTLTSR